MKNIRNFCIIAHIDHGKSTLADRLLEFTHTIQVTSGQMLDNMDLEKERGITIKSHAIQMEYTYQGEKYILNLIDTPGHVDFSYEVSRSIAACEGALLIVDASQGVQAQTISNLYMAIEHDLEIIPVINKCDMASANPEEVEDEIVELLGCKREEVIRASGKTGMGVEEILAAVIERIPHPEGDEEAPLQALIFDSVFNSFRGIIAYFKIENGMIRKGDKVKFFNTGKEYDADEVGVLKMDMVPRNELRTGDVGYIISGIKTSKEVKVGDTITHIARPCKEAIAGFEEVKPMVFAGIYPIESEDYEDLRASIEKLQLNDASLTFEPESSAALGFGFRCCFLGMLHMEIIQERLDREFDMNVITTVPNVMYIAHTTKGDVFEMHNPSDMPSASALDFIEEPFIRAQIITPAEYIGPIMTLCLGKRGILINQQYHTGELRADAAVSGHAGRGRPVCGDGGVLSGAGPPPGGRHHLRYGGVHQPLPGPHRHRGAPGLCPLPGQQEAAVRPVPPRHLQRRRPGGGVHDGGQSLRKEHLCHSPSGGSPGGGSEHPEGRGPVRYGVHGGRHHLPHSDAGGVQRLQRSGGGGTGGALYGPHLRVGGGPQLCDGAGPVRGAAGRDAGMYRGAGFCP